MGSTPLARIVAVVATVLIATACSRMERLPVSFYDGKNANGYEKLPPQLQSTEVDLLYVIDREP